MVNIGPIPAHAGEPSSRGRWCGGAWAYPRSRGGTQGWRQRSCSLQGLSPLTRGNPGHGGSHGGRPGPIPAHAGEPAIWVATMIYRRAYPRSRGGTAQALIDLGAAKGLSPLTRGNPRLTP